MNWGWFSLISQKDTPTTHSHYARIPHKTSQHPNGKTGGGHEHRFSNISFFKNWVLPLKPFPLNYLYHVALEVQGYLALTPVTSEAVRGQFWWTKNGIHGTTQFLEKQRCTAKSLVWATYCNPRTFVACIKIGLTWPKRLRIQQGKISSSLEIGQIGKWHYTPDFVSGNAYLKVANFRT